MLQCDPDLLGCDRLGAFNLSIAVYGECVNFVRKFNVPLLVLGGGGYTIKNASCCWMYGTAVLVGAETPDELPVAVYDPFFRDPQWKLHPSWTGRAENQNAPSVTTKNYYQHLEQAQVSAGRSQRCHARDTVRSGRVACRRE